MDRWPKEITLAKKFYLWQISTWKTAQCHMPLEKHKLKQQGTTTHLFKWPKRKILIRPNTGKNVEL